MKYGFTRCHHCNKEFEAKAPGDVLCPRCEAIEDAQYANHGSTAPEPACPPWKYSRAAMRERLGVNGNVDE